MMTRAPRLGRTAVIITPADTVPQAIPSNLAPSPIWEPSSEDISVVNLRERGTDVTEHLAAIRGFTVQAATRRQTTLTRPTPTTHITGWRPSTSDSLSIYDDATTAALIASIPQPGANAIITVVATAPVPAAGETADLWPVTIGSITRDIATGQAPGTFTVSVVALDLPATRTLA